MTQGGETEEYEFHENGQLAQLGGGQLYIRYIEHQEAIATPVQFRIDREDVQLDRRGPRETRLLFKNHQETMTRYATEYGMIHLKVLTTYLRKTADLASGHGSIQIDYQLKNAGQVLGTYRIQLHFSA